MVHCYRIIRTYKNIIKTLQHEGIETRLFGPALAVIPKGTRDRIVDLIFKIHRKIATADVRPESRDLTLCREARDSVACHSRPSGLLP